MIEGRQRTREIKQAKSRHHRKARKTATICDGDTVCILPTQGREECSFWQFIMRCTSKRDRRVAERERC